MRKARRHAPRQGSRSLWRCSAWPSRPAASAAPKVLVVGDSLEESTSLYLDKYLPGVEADRQRRRRLQHLRNPRPLRRKLRPRRFGDRLRRRHQRQPELSARSSKKTWPRSRRRSATAAWSCRRSTATRSKAPTTAARTGSCTNSPPRGRGPRRRTGRRVANTAPEPAAVGQPAPEPKRAPTTAAQLIAEGILGCLSYAETPRRARNAEPRRGLDWIEPEEIEPVGRMARREEQLLR